MKNYTLIGAILVLGAVAQAADQQPPKPDNTKRNATNQLTAENQGGSAKDREITRNIRRSIVKTDSLSSMGKNVKVITTNGHVTLRGPVHSEQEKMTIAPIAEKFAGKGNVENKLEVKKP